MLLTALQGRGDSTMARRVSNRQQATGNQTSTGNGVDFHMAWHTVISMTAIDIIDGQIESYNKRDLDGFCAWYADDIKIADLGTGEILVDGMAALRQRYTGRFANPGLHAIILNRIAIGSYVTDHEEVGGITEGLTWVVVTYLVQDGLIHRVWMQRT
jgi:hypothetical protein